LENIGQYKNYVCFEKDLRSLVVPKMAKQARNISFLDYILFCTLMDYLWCLN